MHSTLYAYDSSLRQQGNALLAGIDEAGRGPLAGPVVVAGVILPERQLPLDVFDSKQLSEAKREEIAQALETTPDVKIAVAVISAARIDEINILRATHEGMRQVASELNANLTLVDGLPVPDFPLEARFLVKGDATSASIAAASIIAKTRRDAILRQLDEKYPQYGFAKHKGYGTAEHLKALRKFGPCPQHRLSFAPVRDIITPPPEQCYFNF